MSLTSVQNAPQYFDYLLQNENNDFAFQLKDDEDFVFYNKVLLTAFSIQLKRINENYLYEEIEYGHLLEQLSEKPTILKLNQTIDLIKILAKHSFYREERLVMHKVCQGHSEYAKETILSKDYEEEKNKIFNAWLYKKGIKEFEIIKEKAPTLIDPRDHFHALVKYFHIDDNKNCLSPWVKSETIATVCCSSILERFESKLDQYQLNSDAEWTKLAKKIFGDHLILIK